MSSVVDFATVSTTGLEASPIAEALAGLRANEARYITNKYGTPFTVSTPGEDPETLAWVTEILQEERGIVIASPALEVSGFEADGIRFGYVFYASGLAINVMYTLDDAGKRAVGFKLSLGMEIPEELSAFKFARQRSKLAGEIRGSYFVIKGEH
ncbi:phage tail protein [Microbacterium sp. MMO-10]|uniref:phage tail protein n=1 Tax=Microbacterium sp. MMO-10 TaxID=3081272 RepID=UPI003015A2E4|nr:phage tail protein [Actinomycetota bacterium]